ncbi:universal stress protein [Rhodococcus opacus]|uniref:Putative Usp family protein n=1 Tax=Rhodococcus opacus (strain B4) TaxID=632772 RepID=C1AT18_RHOOB|nr:universal stress protein [Rhodococcus opacus]BAH48950.1 putative Usp family protein [Rhodococcus opacus B4]
MSAYRTVVVGTDGSESSFLAVEKAAAIAGDAGAKLIIACAYYPADPKDVGSAADALGDEAYQITGSAPTYEILRTAKERAHAAGAKEVVERAVVGAPVESLLNLVDEVEAGLLVIGNRGLNTLTGRLLGSVPSDAARKSTSDVLIVHTVR